MSDKACAVIIGHGPGVGAAAAAAFAAEGHPVALIARNAGRVTEAASQFGAAGQRAVGVAADAGDASALQAALDQVERELGPPGVVLYNAAFWRPGPVLAITPDMAEADYRTCVVGALIAARWAAPLMAGRGGSLLFTGGGLAMYPSADAPTLSIGKGAIRALALMLADELAPQGIRVGTVTIAGTVGSPGLPAERVAQAFLQLHHGAPSRDTAEVILRV